MNIDSFSLYIKKLKNLRRNQENVVKFHIGSSRLIGLFVFAVLLGGVSPAMARDSTAHNKDDSTASAADSSSQKKIDRDDPQFWAKTRNIYTVQKRPFQKAGRFAVSVYAGMIPNNIFEQYFPAGVRLDYFVLENIGLELASSYAFSTTTGLSDSISEGEGVNAEGVLVGDTQVSHSNFGVVWSPFYGKTSFYNTALNYFDLYLFGGAGLVVTQTQPQFNADESTDYKPEGVLGAGLSFYFGDHAAMRLDYRQFVFQKTGDTGVANPSELSLGASWFF